MSALVVLAIVIWIVAGMCNAFILRLKDIGVVYYGKDVDRFKQGMLILGSFLVAPLAILILVPLSAADYMKSQPKQVKPKKRQRKTVIETPDWVELKLDPKPESKPDYADYTDYADYKPGEYLR